MAGLKIPLNYYHLLLICYAKTDTKKAKKKGKKKRMEQTREMKSAFHGRRRLRMRYFWPQLFAGATSLMGLQQNTKRLHGFLSV